MARAAQRRSPQWLTYVLTQRRTRFINTLCSHLNYCRKLHFIGCTSPAPRHFPLMLLGLEGFRFESDFDVQNTSKKPVCYFCAHISALPPLNLGNACTLSGAPTRTSVGFAWSSTRNEILFAPPPLLPAPASFARFISCPRGPFAIRSNTR